MSDRCSFTSEYIYNHNDYFKLRGIFDGMKYKYLCVAPPAEWGGFEMPIIQGKTAGLCKSEVMESLSEALSEVATENSVRFVILSDSPNNDDVAIWVLDKSPEGYVETREIMESYIQLDLPDKISLNEENYNIK